MNLLASSYFVFFAIGLAIAPAQKSVPTVLGPKAFRDGDVIEITDVQASSTRLEQGDSITVCGKYRLESMPSAKLCLFVTQTEGDGREEVDSRQTLHVQHGRGEFELRTTIKHRGVLHLTFYHPDSGSPAGGVYFGTEEQMKTIEDWQLEYYLTAKSSGCDSPRRFSSRASAAMRESLSSD